MVNEENYEEYIMLHADGELPPAEQEALHAFIAAHPERKADYDLYMSAVLVPDTDTIYPGKEGLLKEEPAHRQTIWISWLKYGMAAALILFAGTWFLMQQSTPTNIAQTETAEESPLPAATPLPKQTAGTGTNLTQETKAAVDKDPNTQMEKTADHRMPKRQIATNTTKQPPAADPKLPADAAVNLEKMPTAITPLQVEDKEAREFYAVALPATGTEDNYPPKDNNILALLQRNEPPGLEAIKTGLVEKVENAKELGAQLKGTDVALKIGKKEIFTITL